jgi:hypothetical protein
MWMIRLFFIRTDTHLSFLRKLFYKMRTANLRLNPRKSLFARESVSFLGFKLSSDTIQPDPKRYQKIRDLQPATNVKQVKMLLGYFSYYRRHIRNFSIISAPSEICCEKMSNFVGHKNMTKLWRN